MTHSRFRPMAVLDGCAASAPLIQMAIDVGRIVAEMLDSSLWPTDLRAAHFEASLGEPVLEPQDGALADGSWNLD